MNILEINTWIGEIEVDILQTKTLYEYYQTIIPVSVNKEINTSIDWCGITVKCNYFSTCIQLDTIALNGLHALTGGNREVFDKLLNDYTDMMVKKMEMALELTEHHVFPENVYVTICNDAKKCFEFFKMICLYGKNNA